MIRNIHTAALRELVAQAERDLAGWQRMLVLAEQEERVGAILPDPMPRPAAPLYDIPAANGAWTLGEPLQRGAAPYPAANSGTPLYDGTLPPAQENAFGAIASEHDAYASTSKAVAEDAKWRQA